MELVRLENIFKERFLDFDGDYGIKTIFKFNGFLDDITDGIYIYNPNSDEFSVLVSINLDEESNNWWDLFDYYLEYIESEDYYGDNEYEFKKRYNKFESEFLERLEFVGDFINYKLDNVEHGLKCIYKKL